MKIKLLLLAALYATSLAVLINPIKAKAAISYNVLISNPVFDNDNSMSASQIDAFLNALPDSCISTDSGFSAKDPTGYNPSDSFQYGSYVSAGTVIDHAAKAYDINPQVILSTLQKEQGLVKGDGPYGCGKLSMSAAMGYNCPDGQTSNNYSGVSIYKRNGTTYTSVTGTCVQNASYVGFSQQIIIAAWQMTFDRHRSEGLNNWFLDKPAWDNSDDLDFCYSGRMIDSGNALFKVCPDQSSPPPAAQFSGEYTIDSKAIHITNGATAALYNYTPHLHGNELFVSIFEDWFGPTRYTGPDLPIMGDWDGDGEATFGIKRGSQILLDSDNDGVADTSYIYGQDNDIPLVGDWDGDGDDTVSLKRGNTYYINNDLASGSDSQFIYGNSGSFALAGDWDGDGDDTVSIRMGSYYYINNDLASGSNFKFLYGNPGSIALAGDWDGDGDDTVNLKIGPSFYVNHGLNSGSDLSILFVN
jgi:hypothetical protein